MLSTELEHRTFVHQPLSVSSQNGCEVAPTLYRYFRFFKMNFKRISSIPMDNYQTDINYKAYDPCRFLPRPLPQRKRGEQKKCRIEGGDKKKRKENKTKLKRCCGPQWHSAPGRKWAVLCTRLCAVHRCAFHTFLAGPVSADSAQPSSSVSPNPSSVSANEAASSQGAGGEEVGQSGRPHSSSRSTTPATSTVRSPPATPTSFSNHTPTPTSAAAAAAAAMAGVLDPRHFPMPPPSPFYAYPGLAAPFHPAFMPVNMVKAEMNSSGGLDTSYVAKTVRELLAMHNIGQRLFAKHVLGLSQGTVSELLSKPKTWDKLTEKGRESYRKMHAWASDDANILALKAMSPKKSEWSFCPCVGSVGCVCGGRGGGGQGDGRGRESAVQVKKNNEIND